MREACERVFRPRFRMPNHARDAPQPLRTNFGEIENLRFRNFGTGSEIWTALTLRSELGHGRHLEIFVELARN